MALTEEEMLAIALKETMATILKELVARQWRDYSEDFSGNFTYGHLLCFLYSMHYRLPDILLSFVVVLFLFQQEA